MVLSYKSSPELGMIEVHTTSEVAHPIEFWADLCKRIISVRKKHLKTYKNKLNHWITFRK